MLTSKADTPARDCDKFPDLGTLFAQARSIDSPERKPGVAFRTGERP